MNNLEKYEELIKELQEIHKKNIEELIKGFQEIYKKDIEAAYERGYQEGCRLTSNDIFSRI